MLPKPEVLRLDIVSHKSFPKDKLFRLVKVDDVYVLDEGQNMKRRGLYVLKDEETLNKLSTKKNMSRYRLNEDVIKRMKECLSKK